MQVGEQGMGFGHIWTDFDLRAWRDAGPPHYPSLCERLGFRGRIANRTASSFWSRRQQIEGRELASFTAHTIDAILAAAQSANGRQGGYSAALADAVTPQSRDEFQDRQLSLVLTGGSSGCSHRLWIVGCRAVDPLRPSVAGNRTCGSRRH
jgi:hypothetical protein